MRIKRKIKRKRKKKHIKYRRINNERKQIIEFDKVL